MPPLGLLDQPPWQRETLTLLHFLWQGLAVAALLVAVLWLFRVRQARTRYALSLLALLAMAACPVLTFAVLEAPTSKTAGAVSAPEPVPPGPSPGPETTISGVKPAGERKLHDAQATSRHQPARGPSLAAWGPAAMRFMRTHQSYLLAGWGAGVALLSVRLLLSVMGLYWVRRGRRPISTELRDCVARLCERIKLRLTLVVMASERIREALVVGFLRPMVLLPASWLVEMTPEVLEAVIAHELAHVRRWDLWVNAFQRVVETLLFYHPAVWWVSRRVRLEREMCCDELAVAATGRRGVYVDTLELVARRRFEPARPALASTLGGGKMILLDRIRYVAGFSPARSRARWWPVGALTLLAGAAVGLASMSPAQQAQGEAPAQQKERPSAASPYQAPARLKGRASAASPSDAKLEHLLKAAEHLEGAGLEEEAKKCRELAKRERKAILSRIEALRAEIERLRRLTDGVQQVLVNVTLVEVSRTKLRKLGFDWAAVSGDGSVIKHSTSGILEVPAAKAGKKETFKFGIVDGDDAFFGILGALRKDKLARLLAEPKLVTVSGRPAWCQLGGEVPLLVPQGEAKVAVEYQKYGTRIDIVPIVLPEGRLRMEVRVRVTDVDWTAGTEIDGKPMPAFSTHEVDAGVELAAGQTLLIRGLAQNRRKGAGWEASPAGTTGEAQEEFELLILMTPELLDAMHTSGTFGPRKPVSPPPLPSTAPRPSTAPLPPKKPAAGYSRYGSVYGHVLPNPPSSAVPGASTAPGPSTRPRPSPAPALPETPVTGPSRYGSVYGYRVPVNSSNAAKNAP